MKVKKLNLGDFKENTLSFTSLKNLTGGARVTDYRTPGDNGDYVDNNEDTKFDCDETIYRDDC